MDSRLSIDQKREILSAALDDRELELIIFPTEQCNFRCTYCYGDFAKGRLSPDHVEAVKRLLTARCEAGLQHLRLSWFGGEPLLAYDIVTDISSHARRLADTHGVRLNVNFTTNGSLLTEARLLELWDYGTRDYQISLDGDADAHDRTRQRKGGGASFDAVYGALQTYNALRLRGALAGTTVMIRLHIHPDNTDSLFALAARIGRDLNPRYFTVYFKEVGYYGGRRDGAYAVYGEQDLRLDEVKHRLAGLLPGFTRTDQPGQVAVCYAGKANSLTIRADGSLGKCTLALNGDYNRVGRLNPEGTLALDGPKLGAWLQGLSTMDPGDLGCPAHRVARQAKRAATPPLAMAG